MASRTRSVQIYAVTLALVAAAILGVDILRGSLDTAFSTTFWLFVGVILVAELRPVQWNHRSTSAVWTLSTPFMLALLLYKGAPVAALVVACASVLTDLLMRRQWDRVLFNAGQYVVITVAAGAVLSILGYVPGSLTAGDVGTETLWPLLPAGIVFVLLGELLVSAVIALDQGRSLFSIMGEFSIRALATNAVLVSLAPLVAVLAGHSLLLVGLLVLPILGLHSGAQAVAEKGYQAEHDLLTGLPNRALFRKHLMWAIESAPAGTGPAVVLLDLNQFKDVNDTLGHQAGDELLRIVADRLTGSLGEEIVVARLGGDEFAVLLGSVREPDEAVEATVGIVAILRKPVVVERFPLDVSASAGIATYPEHGRDADTLLRRAEVAMYVAKDKHGGIEIYSPQRDEHSRRRLALIHDLREAVKAGALTVAYQPKADLATGQIVGMEALVRWDHPQHGPISPEEFIPLAERTGLIAPITAHVLRIALEDCALWHRARFALTVAVNLSPVAIYDRALQRMAIQLIQQWELDPRWLELEITESTIMADPEQAQRVLNQAADMGARLAIDDFGTGYSSLALLKQLPVHELKVDKTFIRHIVHDQSDAAIVKTTIQLARSLGMTVCAEGVETVEIWDRLVELECDVAQGYLLSKPLPARAIMAWLLAQLPGPETWAPTARPLAVLSDAEAAPLVSFKPRQRAT